MMEHVIVCKLKVSIRLGYVITLYITAVHSVYIKRISFTVVYICIILSLIVNISLSIAQLCIWKLSLCISAINSRTIHRICTLHVHACIVISTTISISTKQFTNTAILPTTWGGIWNIIINIAHVNNCIYIRAILTYSFHISCAILNISLKPWKVCCNGIAIENICVRCLSLRSSAINSKT